MIALAFSGGKDSMACLHLMRESIDCAIYVDTGFSYPETLELVRYAGTLVPMHIVKADRAAQNESAGIPADVVPVNWTPWGQLMTPAKPYAIQPYIQCCYENIALPLYAKAKELGITELIFGQRNSDEHKGLARDGTEVFGIVRRHPIESWSDTDVVRYLAERMPIPHQYSFKHTSLDCYDCPAYRAKSKDRVEWMKEKHPDFYQAYRERANRVDGAIQEEQVWL